MDLKIPTKPYLKRYLHYWYPMPYKLKMDNILGSFLYRLLRDQQNDSKYHGLIDQFPVKYTIRLRPKQIFNEGCRTITSNTIYRFNDFVEKILEKELFAYLHQCELNYECTADVYNKKNSPFTIKQGILQFLDKYNISESELSYDTLKKRYYRHRLGNAKKPIRNMSPNTKGKKQRFFLPE